MEVLRKMNQKEYAFDCHAIWRVISGHFALARLKLWLNNPTQERHHG
jgi:hypothetical protein